MRNPYICSRLARSWSLRLTHRFWRPGIRQARAGQRVLDQPGAGRHFGPVVGADRWQAILLVEVPVCLSACSLGVWLF